MGSDGAASHRDRRFFGPSLQVRAGDFDALDFEGVTLRIFPLRASQRRLENFLDDYLHMDIPDELVRFRPAAPYVFFMVVHYGRMSPAASNLGWVSQNEVLFSVPLYGHWMEDGERVEGFATVSPVIFVDNEWSITTGREVYGWPKVLAHLSPEVDPWLRDPTQPRQLLTLRTALFSKLYAGQRLKPRTLVEVQQREARLFGQLPPSIDAWSRPWTVMPKTLLGAWSRAPEVLRAALEASLPSADVKLWPVLARMLGSALGPRPEVFANTVNLKQFRASKPNSICYQALVNSRMIVRESLGGGLLGSSDQMRGDPSGGFSVYIHRYDAFPIVETLGLSVDRQYEWEGVPVAELRPACPFWLSVDMRYEPGRRICWRAQDTDWAFTTQVSSLAAEDEGEPTRTPYNTTLGPVAQAPEGPFDFYDTELRLLALPANRERLERGLPRFGSILSALYPGTELGEFRLAPFPALPGDGDGAPRSLVLLISSTHGRMSAAVNDVGWWASRDLGLAVVLQTPLTGSREGDHLYWLYWAYRFADSPLAVTEGREVLGLPTTYSSLREGSDPWAGPGGLGAPRRVLHLATKDLPAVDVGQSARDRPLLEILLHPGERAQPSRLARRVAELPSSLRVGLTSAHLSLKQIRDEEDPELVCYRSVVAFESLIGRWGDGSLDELDVHALPERFEVRIHDSPNYPLVSALGLEVDHWLPSESGASIASVRPLAAIGLTADLRTHLPVTLARQPAHGRWRKGEGGADYLRHRLADSDARPPEAQEGDALGPARRVARQFARGLDTEAFATLEDLVDHLLPQRGTR